MNILQRLTEPKQTLEESKKIFSDRLLKTMIVPLVVEQLLQMVVGLADTLMVSYAGEATVAGVGLDTMIYTVFIYLFTFFRDGSTNWQLIWSGIPVSDKVGILGRTFGEAQTLAPPK